MRTTVDLDDHLVEDARKLAAERHIPLTRLLEESLRAFLSEQRGRAQQEPAPLPVLAQPAPVTGLDLDDTSRLWEMDRRRLRDLLLEGAASPSAEPADAAYFEALRDRVRRRARR